MLQVLCIWAVCKYLRAVYKFHMQDDYNLGSGYASLAPETGDSAETEPLAQSLDDEYTEVVTPTNSETVLE